MTDHLSKLSSQLSGGNKRKLSIAISLMGLPQIFILDEPTANVDPKARAGVVEILKQVKAQPGTDRCIILTTHLMEESEALCDRVGIMVKGRLQCIGNLQHLKSKFGKGYEMEIKTTLEAISKVKGAVKDHIPNAAIYEEH